MTPAEILWAERDCAAFRETLNRTVPFNWDDLPEVNYTPRPVIDGQVASFHGRNRLSGQIETTYTLLAVHTPLLGLQWTLLSKRVTPTSRYFPCG